VVSSSVRASGRMHHCTTHSRGPLRALPLIRVLMLDRGQPAPGAAPLLYRVVFALVGPDDVYTITAFRIARSRRRTP
jgi:hypothetical protein